MAYTIDIDNFIGTYGYSKVFVKNILSKNSSKDVTVRLNSLGGSVDDALDIAAQFQEHGNVTVDMYAFNASASTLLSLGAKKARMHVDSLYLIHKAMSWVDSWGYMNEDNIQELIDQLEKEKNENAKITLVLARKYATKSGKSINEILDLMKKETWLNSQEAKEWGFVDEVFGDQSSGKKNIMDDSLINKMNAIGLPIPERTNKENSQADPDKETVTTWLEEKWNQLTGGKDKKNKTDNNPQTPIINMKKEWTHINTILSVDGVEESEGKVNLTTDQVEKINAELKAANTAKETAGNLVTDKTNRIAELELELKNLKEADGASTNPVNKEADGGKSYSGGSAYENLAAAYELNKILPED